MTNNLFYILRVFFAHAGLTLRPVKKYFAHKNVVVRGSIACVSRWNHVSSGLNSADLLSCGSRADPLVKGNLW